MVESMCKSEIELVTQTLAVTSCNKEVQQRNTFLSLSGENSRPTRKRVKNTPNSPNVSTCTIDFEKHKINISAQQPNYKANCKYTYKTSIFSQVIHLLVIQQHKFPQQCSSHFLTVSENPLLNLSNVNNTILFLNLSGQPSHSKRHVLHKSYYLFSILEHEILKLYFFSLFFS